jgi:hypothetical protein
VAARRFTHLRHSLVLLGTIFVTAMTVSCTSTAPTGVSNVPSGMGVVVGGILPCYDSGPPPGGYPYVSGTVKVYRGAQISTGESAFESQIVQKGAKYRFVLTPGLYTLMPVVSISNLAPPVDAVRVRLAEVTTLNLAYGDCI